MNKVIQQSILLGILILFLAGVIMLIVKSGEKDFSYRHKSGAEMKVFKK